MTKQQQAHTPLRYSEPTEEYGAVWRGNEIIAKFNDSQDAKDTVRACNSHYELVEALQKLLKALPDVGVAELLALEVVEARAALARATNGGAQ